MGSFSVWHWLIIVLIVSGIVALVRFVNKRSGTDSGRLVGVGGWLVIPIFGFVAVALLTLINIVSMFGDIEGIKLIYFAEEASLAPLRVPIAMSLLFGVAVVISASTCLYRIFIARSGVQKIAVGHYVLLAAAGLVDFWTEGVLVSVLPDLGKDPETLRNAWRGVLLAMIWIPYFLVSKRVQNTFEQKSGASAPLKSQALNK